MKIIDIPACRAVKLSQKVEFHCTLCGDCCRHVKDAVVLESLDIFRLAHHSRMNGHPTQTVKEFLRAYANEIALADSGYPFLVLKTTGSEQTCVFLKENRCSVQPVKPRACRLYPFIAGPGENERPFTSYLSMEKPHHFIGGQVSVNDWFHVNFNRDDRMFVQAEFEFATELGKVMRRLQDQKMELTQKLLLHYKYLHFDLDRPFFPQYRQNNKKLLCELGELARV